MKLSAAVHELSHVLTEKQTEKIPHDADKY